jgi:hypothetical protein
MTPHTPGKPRIGTFVDYYNPQFLQRIGFIEGYGKRSDGPYAALVTNNIGDGLTLTVFLPEGPPTELRSVRHKDKVPTYTPVDGTNHPNPFGGNGYWEWQSPLQAARAAKELKADGD